MCYTGRSKHGRERHVSEKTPKSDREKFYGAFQKKVGCKPEQYLRRKLAGGMPESWEARAHRG